MTRPVGGTTASNPAHRPAASGAGPVSGHSMIRFGSSGPEVRQLQRLLVEQGFMKPPINDKFSDRVTEAVKDYQRAKGLTVDGIVGQQTWGSFNGEKFPPGGWMLKQPVTGHSGTSGYDGTRPGGPVDWSPAAGSNDAEQILNTARKWLGTHEGAGNSNPFSRALGRPGEAWCADFVSYCARKAGLNLNTASAQGVQDYLASHGKWKGRHNPQPGDALTFDWAGRNGWADHVGIVERVYQRGGVLYIDTIEGNSSDQVRRKTYRADDPVIKGYGTIV